MPVTVVQLQTVCKKTRVRLGMAAPTAAAAPSFRPMLITNFCTQTSPDGTWRIGISQRSVDVSRFPGLIGEGWPARSKEGETTVSVPMMGHTGWFAFTENDHRVWYYDGDGLLYLFSFSGETWNKVSWISGGCNCGPFYGDQRCPVPESVFTRLSEQARKKVQNHG